MTNCGISANIDVHCSANGCLAVNLCHPFDPSLLSPDFYLINSRNGSMASASGGVESQCRTGHEMHIGHIALTSSCTHFVPNLPSDWHGGVLARRYLSKCAGRMFV